MAQHEPGNWLQFEQLVMRSYICIPPPGFPNNNKRQQKKLQPTNQIRVIKWIGEHGSSRNRSNLLSVLASYI